MNVNSTDESGTTTAPQCPRCHETMVPIVYGLPPVELGEASSRGEVILGGCCIDEDEMPEWGCVRCEEATAREAELRWGSDDDE